MGCFTLLTILQQRGIFADQIMVMYHGQIVEQGTSDEVILNPTNEYTKILLSAAPNPGRYYAQQEQLRIKAKETTLEERFTND